MRTCQPPRQLVLAGLLAGSILLAACGSETDNGDVPPNLVITVRPRVAATVLPGCATGELSDWYEIAGTLIGTFRDASNAAPDRPPDQLGPVLDRLIDLYDAVADQPVPECALQAHGEIVFTMQEVLASVQRYASGDLSLDELKQQIAASSARIDNEAAALLASAQATLEAQIRHEREASPTPFAPSPTAEG